MTVPTDQPQVEDAAPPAPLPADTAMSRVQIYDWPTADGEHGGSAHTHLVCTEAYLVLAGRGRLQTLGAHGFAEVPLRERQIVWFTPGTIHRPINDDGLEVMVLMQNAGLPEAGDAVLTFPPEVLADPDRYADAVAAASTHTVFTSDEERARGRRDLAIEGFCELRQQVETDGPAALTPFYQAAQRLVAPKLAAWEKVWRAGPLAAAERTGAQLDALARGDLSHLGDSGVWVNEAPQEPQKFGMCGRLSSLDARSAVRADGSAT